MTLNAIAFKCPYKADVLVLVNYTKLGGSADGGINSVVQVMLGSVTDDPTAVIRRTEVPALLIPGVNFVGFAKMHILQKFKMPKLSTLGVFGVGRTRSLYPHFSTPPLLVIRIRPRFRDCQLISRPTSTSIISGT